RLDVLVNNAGLTGLPLSITAEGLEQTFTTNYLGPFLLTNLLLDLLKASAPARIVNVSSFRHAVGTVDVRYLSGQAQPGGYDPIYNSTKLMNVLFSAELAQRLQGTGVTTNSVNPGVVSTGIMRRFSWPLRTLFFLIRPFIKVSAGTGGLSGSCPTAGGHRAGQGQQGPLLTRPSPGSRRSRAPSAPFTAPSRRRSRASRASTSTATVASCSPPQPPATLAWLASSGRSRSG
uniref:Retinol dehydrogenase 13 n=1 Tax=Anas platyrhynchos platyrhynchos TaxID=8840 RepID=A0A493SSA1_ANAPP